MNKLENIKKDLTENSYSEFSKELHNFLKIRSPLIYVICKEEKRFIKFLDNFSEIKGYKTYTWDCSNGLRNLAEREFFTDTTDKNLKNNVDILEYIENEAISYNRQKSRVYKIKESGINGFIYVLLDGFRFLDNPIFERKLKNLLSLNSIFSVIITGNYSRKSTLDNLIPFMETPMPNRKEYELSINDIITGVENQLPHLKKEVEENKDILLNIFDGLTIVETQRIFTLSLVNDMKLNLEVIKKMKQNILKGKNYE